jgi:SET domain
MAGLPKRPVAIYPTHMARRIGNQRSCFTIHGQDVNGLENLKETKNPCLVKIVVPSFRTEEIRQELDTCGIDDATIFPDLEGLSRAVAARWRPRKSAVPHAFAYTRLRPSKVAKGGVGVFAIRKIKKGARVFLGDRDEMVWIEEGSLPKTPLEVRRLYDDFAVIKGKRYGCPPSFNRLTIAWYLNDSKKPNLRSDADYEFFALRDVEPGEELTVDYSTYSDSPPATS